MVRKNNEKEMKFSAKIILRGKGDYEKKKEKAYFNRREIEKIECALQGIQKDKEDALLVLEYLINGKMIELQEGKIYLYPHILHRRRTDYLWFISDSPELFALLEQIVQS